MVKPALRAIWTRWKAIAHTIADFQARLLLSIFYFVVLGPFAVAVRACSGPPRLAPGSAGGWVSRPDVDGDPLSWAKKQF